jgi:hypothetical protein
MKALASQIDRELLVSSFSQKKIVSSSALEYTMTKGRLSTARRCYLCARRLSANSSRQSRMELELCLSD